MNDHSKEGIDFFKTFILIIIVLGAIAFVVAIFTNFQSQSIDKASELDATASAASEAIYSNYDNTVVSGKDVTSCADLYKGRDFIIAVITSTGAGSTYFNISNAGTALLSSSAQYYYNALPSGATAGTAGNYVTVGADRWEGRYTVQGLSYSADTGLVDQNANYAPMSSKANGETYVKPNGKFHSSLIYDTSTGEVAGFLFQQVQ